MSGQVWWYLARAAGIVTLVLLAGTFVLGILFSTRALKPHDRPAWLLAMHRWFSTLVVIGTGLHVLALVLDSFVAFGPREILGDPNRFNAYLIGGYAVMSSLGLLYMLYLYVRQRNLQNDVILLGQLLQEDLTGFRKPVRSGGEIVTGE